MTGGHCVKVYNFFKNKITLKKFNDSTFIPNQLIKTQNLDQLRKQKPN